MSHTAIPFVGAASIAAIASLAAQEVRPRLVANSPFVVVATVPSGTYSASGPAGPIPANGSVTLSAPEPYAGAMGWTTSPTGRRWRFWNSMYATYPIQSVAFLDVALWLSAPPTRGHLRIELFSTGDFPGDPMVDVFDDGTVDAVLPTTGSSWDLAVDVHVPVHLTATPIPVRIRLFASVPAPLYMHADIAWEPWHPAAKDLGSGCAPNLIHPAHSLEDYFLAALPGTAGNAVDFVADGLGTLATFIVATDPARLAPGLLGLGYGCDDLLLAPLLDTPGTLIDAGRWQLSVPPLPAGLLFYVQHVSLGPGYLGSTNLVAYRT